ncbi:uncharacterized protein Z518_06261 [Rhinocladiella mackenziei CBS 650.93]|uniref:Homeobox domain-containing protein n=1 Tax=Rhinocladiella mackenziei CBS 650.93 TaxID=1442369 RepID=A0A0D2IHZ9_9EURO|nr:uncharacterized protein Z518_06261 [Rhinocladiella mackenziei CBS 650.93]KIX05389.1 hypothetical protein Z518_06261 [Rhinocladiella mackenziei CBS 650.93]
MEECSDDKAESGHDPDLKPQYAFQVHRHSSISSTTPAAKVKAKRRRTSPQDHAILEAAYVKNSKPDKAERALIVRQVDLGEKEVQIWFQNRRQNDRRRSKPLQPHELVAHFRNSPVGPLPLHMTSPPIPEDTVASNTRPNLSPASETINRPASRASGIHDLLHPTSSPEASPDQDAAQGGTQNTAAQSTPLSGRENTTNEATPEKQGIKVGESDTKEQEGSGETGSGRKRDHDEMTGAKTGPSSSNEAETPSRVRESLPRSSSMVRLAMTVDGAVKIRINNEPTPSPEKPCAAPPASQEKAKGGLARSKSAMGVDTLRESGQGPRCEAIGAGFGRSRDARTWEFFCDSNSNDALATQAEAETAGSAVSAINLIRSNSFKSRSQALSPSLTQGRTRSTTALREGKPKLSRAKSSLGRLQGFDGVTESSGHKPKHSGHVRSPSGDSDKENWAPGTRMSEHALRRTQPSGCQRPILQENKDMTFPDPGSSRKRRGERTGGQPSPSKEKAKGEELDCVQGLLSLSQGAWR